MSNKKDILKTRFKKLKSHYIALKEYHLLIDEILASDNILTKEKFNFIKPQKRAIFDAYLKRFASIQDFLGAKIFPLLIEISGIGVSKMTEILYAVEKEEIIDSLEHWIELREIRNELEHDYPNELEEVLVDLRYCIDNFGSLEAYYFNSLDFANRFYDEIIK